MNYCKYYKGTAAVDATHTKIGCGCVEGGLTYANNDPEGRIVNKCWSGGTGCPYKMDHEAATSIISAARPMTKRMSPACGSAFLMICE